MKKLRLSTYGARAQGMSAALRGGLTRRGGLQTSLGLVRRTQNYLRKEGVKFPFLVRDSLNRLKTPVRLHSVKVAGVVHKVPMLRLNEQSELGQVARWCLRGVRRRVLNFATSLAEELLQTIKKRGFTYRIAYLFRRRCLRSRINLHYLRR